MVTASGGRLSHRRSLAEAEAVHLGCAPLDLDDSLSTQLTQLLSPDECKRAAKFAFDRARRRYVDGRGVLRLIQSSYIGYTPDTLTRHSRNQTGIFNSAG
jgi:hypothetical protein